MTGELITYQNNNMSLSCRGEMEIVDNVIVNRSFKGMPRVHGDNWVYYYKSLKVGDVITQEMIDSILKFNGNANVISKFSSK